MHRLLISIFLIITMVIPAHAVKYIVTNNNEGICEWISRPDSSTGEVRNFKNLKVFFEWCRGKDQVVTSCCVNLAKGSQKETSADMKNPQRRGDLSFRIRLSIEEWINGKLTNTLKRNISDVYAPSQDSDTLNFLLKKIHLNSRFKRIEFDHTIDTADAEEASKQLTRRAPSNSDEDSIDL